jgi:hypothetical protein
VRENAPLFDTHISCALWRSDVAARGLIAGSRSRSGSPWLTTIGCPDRCRGCSRGEPPVLPLIRRRPAEYRALMTGDRAQGLLVALRIRFGAVADLWSYSALRNLGSEGPIPRNVSVRMIVFDR